MACRASNFKGKLIIKDTCTIRTHSLLAVQTLHSKLLYPVGMTLDWLQSMLHIQCLNAHAGGHVVFLTALEDVLSQMDRCYNTA